MVQASLTPSCRKLGCSQPPNSLTHLERRYPSGTIRTISKQRALRIFWLDSEATTVENSLLTCIHGLDRVRVIYKHWQSGDVVSNLDQTILLRIA
ncbi:hypothetical protein GMOD_00008878 [Pyrenophora seminiperda CCB06]|uniref:Uncharacterized protein n=1 Tax=Pyrenophora seminiperda CCB06 TaxID=1302712 RepID=A0A3M7M640_9PLEO|nr:hypothetical protein GMOD_00008878 [Pyrenophora seminiperda CCB06]